MNPFREGDRVVVTADGVSCYLPVPKGSSGTVVRASQVRHATANGGDYELGLELDYDPHAEVRKLRQSIAWMELSISSAYIDDHAHEVAVRSSQVRREDS